MYKGEWKRGWRGRGGRYGGLLPLPSPLSPHSAQVPVEISLMAMMALPFMRKDRCRVALPAEERLLSFTAQGSSVKVFLSLSLPVPPLPSIKRPFYDWRTILLLLFLLSMRGKLHEWTHCSLSLSFEHCAEVSTCDNGGNFLHGRCVCLVSKVASAEREPSFGLFIIPAFKAGLGRRPALAFTEMGEAKFANPSLSLSRSDGRNI